MQGQNVYKLSISADSRNQRAQSKAEMEKQLAGLKEAEKKWRDEGSEVFKDY
jgi:hypothetical protein